MKDCTYNKNQTPLLRDILVDLASGMDAGTPYYRFGEAPLVYAANAIGFAVAIQHRFWSVVDDQLVPQFYKLAGGELVKPSNHINDRTEEVLLSDPLFFSPTNPDLGSRVWFAEWMGLNSEAFIPDFEERAVIVKDFASKVASVDGGVARLWDDLAGNVWAFYLILDTTTGYNDPDHHKKGNLLVKMMEDHGFWTVQNRTELAPPLDYHLINIAVKTGLVDIQSADLRNRLANRRVLTDNQASELRLACRDAYQELTKTVDPWLLDSILWSLSREFCYDAEPSCAECPLATACKSSVGGELRHSFPAIYTDAF